MTSTIESPKIVIVEDLCKGCGICIEFCPAKMLKAGRRIAKKGIFAPEIIDASKCTGCRICQYYCPDFAIFVLGGSKGSR